MIKWLGSKEEEEDGHQAVRYQCLKRNRDAIRQGSRGQEACQVLEGIHNKFSLHETLPYFCSSHGVCLTAGDKHDFTHLKREAAYR